MATAERADIREKDVVGLKYFDQLKPLLARLHDAGCARDKANNRALHFDQYCSLVLLFLFNPVVNSLRAIQQASALRNVQKKLGCGRASLGSLSESVRVFDPSLLEGVVAELGQQLQPLATDPNGTYLRCCLTALWTKSHLFRRFSAPKSAEMHVRLFTNSTLACLSNYSGRA